MRYRPEGYLSALSTQPQGNTAKINRDSGSW